MRVKIHFTRDSVCMGDDCLDNSRNFQFNRTDSWDKIMPVILESNFLASVSGNNVVWVLKNSEDEEILSYFTLQDKIIKCNTDMTIDEICNGNYTLSFKYYTSPEKRGEYIYKFNGCSEYNIVHDGWEEEYRLCR